MKILKKFQIVCPVYDSFLNFATYKRGTSEITYYLIASISSFKGYWYHYLYNRHNPLRVANFHTTFGHIAILSVTTVALYYLHHLLNN